MANKQPIELFMPPNMIKAKVGNAGPGGLDMAAIKRAESAMEEIRGEFAEWLADDLDKLVSARARFAQTPDAGSRAALLRAALDMKGQAGTFDYPLIARVAGSLAKLLDELPEHIPLPVALIDAHVSAIRVIHRDKVQDAGDKMASALSTELEKQVKALVPA